MKKLTVGLVHIYWGDGKGKTSAAVGLAARAAGEGLSCLFCQFLKGTQTGELASLEKAGVTILRTERVKKFIPWMDEREKNDCQEDVAACFAYLKKVVEEGEFDVVVADEILDAVACGLIGEDELVSLLARRDRSVELVLTGRAPTKEVEKYADYNTRFEMLAHPYDKGILARKGIEY